jgi:HlyD family secretion protein
MKKPLRLLLLTLAAALPAACNRSDQAFDAGGIFEAEEVIVSSELAGRILSLDLQEGQALPAGKQVGEVEAQGLELQKQQVQASIRALQDKTADVKPQVRLLREQLAVQQAQLASLQREYRRTQNLVRDDAATGKQLDEMASQLEVAEKQIRVTRQQIRVQQSQVGTQNRGILSEKSPLEKRVAQLEDQLERARIRNPVAGTVLTKYAEPGEITAPGKALYKIADLSTLVLRAYLSGSQLPQVKLNQPVRVMVDQEEGYKSLPGTITWIADQAEFTPKTIQTREERASRVYAVKVRVKNDGYLKIGMYGQVALNPQP